MALKYSRQRETIKDFLMVRKDHPTADTVYMNVRKSYPNISLGTVYRNLTILAEIGEISRVRIGDGLDRFDTNTAPHCHFICRQCGAIIDLMPDYIGELIDAASESFEGRIDSCLAYFYGICKDCLKTDRKLDTV